MSDPEYHDGAGRSRTAYRGRLVLLITLPVLLLGGSYFLFIEYLFAQPDVEFSDPLTALRIGGAAFIILAVIFAFCCGFVALSRMSRSVRVLLHLAEDGTLSPEAGSFLYRSDWDAFYLSKRLLGLQAQSQSGAAAKDELKRVKHALGVLQEDLVTREGCGEATTMSRGGAEAGEVGDATVGEGTVKLVSQIARSLQANQDQLAQFFADLRTQTEVLREEIEGLRSDSSPSPPRIRPESPHAHAEVEAPVRNGDAELRAKNGSHGSRDRPPGGEAPDEDAPDGGASSIDEAAERLRQLGSVLALEMERVDPDPAGLGVRYQRFAEALEGLESALARVSSMKAGVEDVDTVKETDESPMPAAAVIRWDHLEEILEILERRLDEVSDR